MAPDGVRLTPPVIGDAAWSGKRGKRAFTIGVLACAGMLTASLFATEIVALAGGDPRLLVAALPVLYVPLLMGGVGWLIWVSARGAAGK